MAITLPKRDETKPATVTITTDTALPVDISKFDPALLAAWRRFLDFDLASMDQKGTYQRIRQAIILLGALASTIAIVITFFAPDSPLRTLFRIALIVLPVATVALMNYGAQFAVSTHWVEYRVAGEIIRSQIYLYRLDAEKYHGKSPEDKQALLLNEVETVDHWVQEQNIDRPQLQPISDRELLQRIREKTEGGDNGFEPLDIDRYIQWRVANQLNWYKQKIQEDRRMTRRNRVIAIGIAALGSVFAGIGNGLESLVGVTTAIGAALTTSSDVRMYGRTYRIYYDAACGLQNVLNEWSILPSEKRTEPQKARFATEFERIFDQERRQWRDETIKTQMTSEQAIYAQVKQVAGNRVENLPPLAVANIGELPDVTIGQDEQPANAAPNRGSSTDANKLPAKTETPPPPPDVPEAQIKVVKAGETGDNPPVRPKP
ncbi:MAG: DUF4231 domain-containing protein [Chloroflexi bacterium]|nr:DUF4231 domain-containing protein [Chloroflexota bacterium]